MSLVMWHMIDEPSEPEEGLALDLASCVYDGFTTRVWTSTPSGGNACDFNSDTGLEAWCQVDTTVFQGVDFATPYVGPGGDISSNGNSLTATIGGAKFSQDGTYLFTTGTTAIRTLGTPYLLSSGSITSVNASLDGLARTISWDGMHVYLVDVSNFLQKWDLLSPWDLVGAVAVGTPVELPAAPTGICVSQDQSRVYIITLAGDPVPKVVQEFIMATPGDPATIPVDGFSVAIPNYELDVTSYMNSAVDLAVSYNQEHLMISGASAGGGSDGAYLVTFTGNAV